MLNRYQMISIELTFWSPICETHDSCRPKMIFLLLESHFKILCIRVSFLTHYSWPLETLKVLNNVVLYLSSKLRVTRSWTRLKALQFLSKDHEAFNILYLVAFSTLLQNISYLYFLHFLHFPFIRLKEESIVHTGHFFNSLSSSSAHFIFSLLLSILHLTFFYSFAKLS